MKYLVLRRFRSMGVTHFKGSVVDESLIRSPRIRISEGKIVPVVSSLEVPEEVVTEEATSEGTSSIENKVAETSSEESEEAPKKFSLRK